MRYAKEGIGIKQHAQQGILTLGGDHDSPAEQQGNGGFLGGVPPRGVGADGIAATCVGIDGDHACEDGAQQAEEGERLHLAALGKGPHAEAQRQRERHAHGCRGAQLPQLRAGN